MTPSLKRKSSAAVKLDSSIFLSYLFCILRKVLRALILTLISLPQLHPLQRHTSPSLCSTCALSFIFENVSECTDSLSLFSLLVISRSFLQSPHLQYNTLLQNGTGNKPETLICKICYLFYHCVSVVCHLVYVLRQSFLTH